MCRRWRVCKGKFRNWKCHWSTQHIFSLEIYLLCSYYLWYYDIWLLILSNTSLLFLFLSINLLYMHFHLLPFLFLHINLTKLSWICYITFFLVIFLHQVMMNVYKCYLVCIFDALLGDLSRDVEVLARLNYHG